MKPSPSIIFCFQLLLRRRKTSTLSIQRCCSPNASFVGSFFSLLALFLVKSSWKALMVLILCPNHFSLRFFKTALWILDIIRSAASLSCSNMFYFTVIDNFDRKLFKQAISSSLARIFSKLVSGHLLVCGRLPSSSFVSTSLPGFSRRVGERTWERGCARFSSLRERLSRLRRSPIRLVASLMLGLVPRPKFTTPCPPRPHAVKRVRARQ